MSLTLPAHLLLRPTAPHDLQAVTELLNTCAVEQIGRAKWQARDILSEWQTPYFRLETDSCVVAQADRSLVGHASLWNNPPHVRLYAFARVHPAHTDRGIGTALCQWIERRARQDLGKAPPGASVLLLQETLGSNQAARHLLQAQGYRPLRYHVRMRIEMAYPPPLPEPPEGVSIHPFQAGQQEHALYCALREVWRDQWGYIERPFDEDYAWWLRSTYSDPDFDPTLWFLALEKDEIAGLALCSPKTTEDPEMGWVDQLGVRRPWRRRGLGLALLCHAFGAFYQRRIYKVGLGVDTQSPSGATQFYQKAGMISDRQYVTYGKELPKGENDGTTV